MKTMSMMIVASIFTSWLSSTLLELTRESD